MLKKFFRLTLALTALLSLVLPALPAEAAGASISLSANHSTIADGGTVVVEVYMNGGGTPVDAVEADVTYPAGKLQYAGFSSTGTAFEISAEHDAASNGVATVARGTTSPVSGSGLIGAFTFRALVGSGSAAFGIAGSSALVSAGNPVAFGTSGASVKFGAAAPSAKTGGTTTSKTTTASAPATPKDTTPPVISNVKATSVTSFSATITWTTNEPSGSVVEYGLDASYGLSASSAALTTKHAVALDSAFLTPLTLLHYQVKSTDASGNVATGSDQRLQLPGVAVTVIVRGADGRPQSGVSVTLGSNTAITDSHGTVVLPSSLGNQKITTTYQGVTVQKPITVTKSSRPLPPYQLDLAKKPLNSWMLTSFGLIVIVLTLLGLDAALFGSRLFAKLTGLHFAGPAVGDVARLSAEQPAAAKHHWFRRYRTAAAPAAATPPVGNEEIADKAGETAAEPDPEKTLAGLMGESSSAADPNVNAPAAPPISHFAEPSPNNPAAALPTVKLTADPPPEPQVDTGPQDAAVLSAAPSLPPLDMLSLPGVTRIAVQHEAAATAGDIAGRLRPARKVASSPAASQAPTAPELPKKKAAVRKKSKGPSSSNH